MSARVQVVNKETKNPIKEAHVLIIWSAGNHSDCWTDSSGVADTGFSGGLVQDVYVNNNRVAGGFNLYHDTYQVQIT